MKMKFDYRETPDKTGNELPNGKSFCRPEIEIKLRYKNKEKEVCAWIDSGTDYCLFDVAIGRELGIKIENGQHVVAMGVDGPIDTYFHAIKLVVEGWETDCYAGFCNLGNQKSGRRALLGTYGFFDQYAVLLNFKKKVIELNRTDK